MNLTITHRLDPQAMRLLLLIKSQQEKIMVDQATHAAELQALKDQVVKSRNEIIKLVGDLTAALNAAGGTTAEVDAAMAALRADAMAALRAELQITDDLVPDAPTP